MPQAHSKSDVAHSLMDTYIHHAGNPNNYHCRDHVLQSTKKVLCSKNRTCCREPSRSTRLHPVCLKAQESSPCAFLHINRTKNKIVLNDTQDEDNAGSTYNKMKRSHVQESLACPYTKTKTPSASANRPPETRFAIPALSPS